MLKHKKLNKFKMNNLNEIEKSFLNRDYWIKIYNFYIIYNLRQISFCKIEYIRFYIINNYRKVKNDIRKCNNNKNNLFS